MASKASGLSPSRNSQRSRTRRLSARTAPSRQDTPEVTKTRMHEAAARKARNRCLRSVAQLLLHDGPRPPPTHETALEAHVTRKHSQKQDSKRSSHHTRPPANRGWTYALESHNVGLACFALLLAAFRGFGRLERVVRLCVRVMQVGRS